MEVWGSFSLPLWLLVLLLTVVLLVVYLKWTHSTFSKLNIPGPAPGLVGILPRYGRKGIFHVDRALVKQYGRIVGVYHGRQPVLLVADPDMVKQICIKNFSSFPNRYVESLPLSEIFSTSVSMVKDDHWRFARGILSPGFSSGKMRQMVSLIQQNAENMKQNIQAKSAKKESIDMKELFGAYSMDVIASTGFGIVVDSQKNPNDPFVENAKKVMSFKFGFLMLLNNLFPFMSNIMMALGLSIADDKATNFFVNVARKAMQDRTEKDKNRPDLLQLMLNSRKGSSSGAKGEWDEEKFKAEGMPNIEVTANTMILMTAAYETTSTSLTFTAYVLAVNPDIQERLAAEIKTNVGMALPTYDNVWNLPYLDAVFSESLRMYPPALRYNRCCVEETTLNGFTIPRGLEVNVAVYAMHHDPDIFPDPETFNPDRFLPENRDSIPEYAWVPFGAGPRHCVGMRLALVESKMALVTMLQHFRLQTGPDTKIPAELDKTSGFCKAEHPVYLRLEPRF